MPDLTQALLDHLDTDRAESNAHRRELTAAVREQSTSIAGLADAMRAHEAGSVSRQVELMGALRSRDAGAEAAVNAIDRRKSLPERAVEKVATETWPTIRPVVGMIIVLTLMGLVARVTGIDVSAAMRVLSPAPLPTLDVAPAPVEPPAPADEPEAAPVGSGPAVGGHGDGNPMHDQPEE